MDKIKRLLFSLANRLGFYVVPVRLMHADIQDSEFWEIFNLCKPYTMTGVERMYALFSSIKYILANRIPGSFVECGVWRGGSAMMIAKMLSNRKIEDRKIYLFDTFEGMSEPTREDVNFMGSQASTLLEDKVKDNDKSFWCLADLSDVQNNMQRTNFPETNIVYIKGKVEDTLPAAALRENIALLRLDTDWYESTKHELVHLFPKLERNGILIIDDYGYWKGCRKAVDEYFAENGISMLLNRIDSTGRIGLNSVAMQEI